MEWVVKKRKSFDQRGEMAASAWAEQQMRDLNLKARRAARDKVLLSLMSDATALVLVSFHVLLNHKASLKNLVYSFSAGEMAIKSRSCEKSSCL